jgi:N-methylhydantoinase A
MNFRVQSYGVRPKPQIRGAGASGSGAARPSRHREVHWYEEGGARETAIFTGDAMAPGVTIEGPAVIELPTTTVAVRPGQVLEVDAFGNYVVTNR